MRVVIEHVHSGIKRLRMMGDTLHLRGEWRCDTIMLVARRLHSLRITSLYCAYLAHLPAKLVKQPDKV